MSKGSLNLSWGFRPRASWQRSGKEFWGVPAGGPDSAAERQGRQVSWDADGVWEVYSEIPGLWPPWVLARAVAKAGWGQLARASQDSGPGRAYTSYQNRAPVHQSRKKNTHLSECRHNSCSLGGSGEEPRAPPLGSRRWPIIEPHQEKERELRLL